MRRSWMPEAPCPPQVRARVYYAGGRAEGVAAAQNRRDVCVRVCVVICYFASTWPGVGQTVLWLRCARPTVYVVCKRRHFACVVGMFVWRFLGGHAGSGRGVSIRP